MVGYGAFTLSRFPSPWEAEELTVDVDDDVVDECCCVVWKSHALHGENTSKRSFGRLWFLWPGFALSWNSWLSLYWFPLAPLAPTKSEQSFSASSSQLKTKGWLFSFFYCLVKRQMQRFLPISLSDGGAARFGVLVSIITLLFAEAIGSKWSRSLLLLIFCFFPVLQLQLLIWAALTRHEAPHFGL